MPLYFDVRERRYTASLVYMWENLIAHPPQAYGERYRLILGLLTEEEAYQWYKWYSYSTKISRVINKLLLTNICTSNTEACVENVSLYYLIISHASDADFLVSTIFSIRHRSFPFFSSIRLPDLSKISSTVFFFISFLRDFNLFPFFCWLSF